MAPPARVPGLWRVSRRQGKAPQGLSAEIALRVRTALAPWSNRGHRDADLGRGAADAGERLRVERDALLGVAALEPGLEEARRVKLVDPRTPPAGAELAAHLVGAGANLRERAEGVDAQRHAELAVLPRDGAVRHVAALQAVARAREQGREHPDHHGG